MLTSLSLQQWPSVPHMTKAPDADAASLHNSPVLRTQVEIPSHGIATRSNSKMSPTSSSSVSGETEEEEVSLSDHNRPSQTSSNDRSFYQPRVGENASFFDMSYLTYELQSLEETSDRPQRLHLNLQSSLSAPSFSTSSAGEVPSMLNFNYMQPTDADLRASNDINEKIHKQQQLLQRRMEMERAAQNFHNLPETMHRAPPQHHISQVPAIPYHQPRVSANHSGPYYDGPQNGTPRKPVPAVLYNVPNPAARIAQQHGCYAPPVLTPPSVPHLHHMVPPRLNPAYPPQRKPAHEAAYDRPVATGVPTQYPLPFPQASTNGRIYQVQFKGTVRYFILGSQAPQNISLGEFVVVEADRGEDIGIATDILPMKVFIERRYLMKAAVDEEDNTIGRIVRIATASERQQLPGKAHDEQNVMQFCRELAHHTYRLPLMIQDAEYQYDRHKLTIYYYSETRVDFRELVRDLFSAFKARIWMKRVSPQQPFRLDHNAAMSLSSGLHQPVSAPQSFGHHPHY